MIEYPVDIEICGEQKNAGRIYGSDTDTAVFAYSDEYLADKNASALSVSLPLRKDPFSVKETKNFFEGLLPEGFTRKTVAGWLRVDENDYLALLKELGRECIGAIKIRAGEDEEPAKYIKLSKTQMAELSKEGTETSAKYVTRTHISLAGASGKTGLYFDKNSNEWFLPIGAAPSTHIVKQSHIRLSGIVTNERLSMMTAGMLGIDVPESFIVDFGDASDENVLFATKRYDRFFTERSKEISGLQVPFRLHQEDFGQALMISPSEKYEQNGDSYLKKMFELLRKHSANPIEDQLKLWDIVIFNYLIGNTDGHVKNFALIYDETLKKIRLAPAYDIISTVLYKSSTKNMAFSIGGKYDIDGITKENFEEEARKSGLGITLAMRRISEISGQFEEALKKSVETLEKQGYKKAPEMGKEILARKNCFS